MATSLETLRFVLLGDDRASESFSRFARNVDEARRAIDRFNAKATIGGAAAGTAAAGAGGGLFATLFGGGLTSPGAIGLGALGLAGVVPPAGMLLGLTGFAAVAVPTIMKVEAAQKALNAAQKAYASATTPAGRASALKAEQAATAGLSGSQIKLMHSITGVKDAFSGLFTKLGPMIATALQPVAKLAKDFLPLLGELAKSGAKAFDALLKPIDALVKSGVFDEFIHVMGKVGVAFAKLAGPMVAKVLADIMRLFIQLAPAGMTLWRALAPLIQTLVYQFAGILGKVLPPLTVAFAGIIKAITPLIAPIAQLVIKLLPPLAQLFGAIIVPVIKILVGLIKQGLIPIILQSVKAFDQVVKAVLPLIPPLMNLLIQIIPPLQKLIQGPLIGALKWFSQFLITIIIPIIRTWVGWLKNLISFVANVVVPQLKNAWNAIKTDVSNVWNGIINFFKGIPTAIKNALSTLFDVGKTAMTNFWNGIKSVGSSILGWLEGLVDKGQSLLSLLNPFSGGSGSPGPKSGQAGANAALARRMVPAWSSGANWTAWNNVAMHESGWSNTAWNPSGAFGIAQALPYTKMPKAGWPTWAGGVADPATQISWMAGYMQQRYGGPQGAWAWWQGHQWYDQGGWLQPGVTVAHNTTGRPERVGGGGCTYNIYVGVLGSEREAGRRIVEAIRMYERGSGKGWRS